MSYNHVIDTHDKKIALFVNLRPNTILLTRKYKNNIILPPIENFSFNKVMSQLY